MHIWIYELSEAQFHTHYYEGIKALRNGDFSKSSDDFNPELTEKPCLYLL